MSHTITKCSYKYNQNGNVLFLILIAVALFAALSYAITSASRSGGGDVSAEKADMLASEMVQMAGYAKATFDRMRISGNLSAEQIEYAVDNSTNNASCTTNACRLHHPQGGGLINRPAPREARIDPASTGNDNYTYVLADIDGIGTDLPDLLLYIYNIKPEVCEAINRRVGITGIPAPVSMSPGTAFNLVVSAMPVPGVFPATTANIGEEAAATEIRGKSMFCYCHVNPCNTAGGHDSAFVSVLLER